MISRKRHLISVGLGKCLSIVSDKSILGGAVNRAKEMLEKAGERGRYGFCIRREGGDKTEGAAIKEKQADEGESVNGAEQKRKNPR